MTQRNRERERRALSHLAFHPDPPPMQFNELPRQSQAEPGAFDLLGSRPDLLELLEDRLLILWRNPDPGVGHRDLDAAVDGDRAHVDAASFRRELDRIREEVQDYLADFPLIAVDL